MVDTGGAFLGAAGQRSDTEPEAGAAQLLLVLVFFEDGQGIITFLLFGLQPEVLDSLGTLWRGAQARFAEMRWWRWVLCLGDGRDAAVSDATRMTRNALDGVNSLRMSAGGVPGSE